MTSRYSASFVGKAAGYSVRHPRRNAPGWQLCLGISGNLRLERVATFPWNTQSVATLLWNTQLRTQIGRNTYIFLLDITTTGKTGKLGDLSIHA